MFSLSILPACHSCYTYMIHIHLVYNTNMIFSLHVYALYYSIFNLSLPWACPFNFHQLRLVYGYIFNSHQLPLVYGIVCYTTRLSGIDLLDVEVICYSLDQFLLSRTSPLCHFCMNVYSLMDEKLRFPSTFMSSLFFVVTLCRALNNLSCM